MSTVQEVISRALRTIRVLDPQEAPTGADMSTAIGILNAMCRRWEANGLAIGWQPVTNPSDTMPIPDEAEEAVVYNLAGRLGIEYGQPLTRELAFAAENSLMELRRDRFVEMPLNQMTGLPAPNSWSGQMSYAAFYNGDW